MRKETRVDFLRWLQIDVVLKILSCFHDPADLIRASAVSHYWRDYVISYGLCKQLCVKAFPQIASISHVTEPNHNSEPTSDDLADNPLEREHKTYSSLLWALTSFPLRFCITYPVSASSTDRFPQESIINTIDPRAGILDRASYWSSKGHDDPDVPETLIYNLGANFCLITEIEITPFQALFQEEFPLYSAKFVRFRMGHPISFKDINRDFMETQECADDKFVWTYTSQTFAMVQESRLQKFKLPEPVLCIGGFLQIELLGRVQKQRSDNKYYICVAHVQARGRQLSPAFSFDFSEPSNTISLKYNAKEFQRTVKIISEGNKSRSTHIVPPPSELVSGNLQDYLYMIQQGQNGMEVAALDVGYDFDPWLFL